MIKRRISNPDKWVGEFREGVIVNFICQFDWVMGCVDIWLTVTSTCVCECVFFF